jgi:hypothetical protein
MHRSIPEVTRRPESRDEDSRRRGLASGFPRWLAAVTEALPQGQPLPNLADLLQERCEKLLEQVCMPIQGGVSEPSMRISENRLTTVGQTADMMLAVIAGTKSAASFEADG